MRMSVLIGIMWMCIDCYHVDVWADWYDVHVCWLIWSGCVDWFEGICCYWYYLDAHVDWYHMDTCVCCVISHGGMCWVISLGPVCWRISPGCLFWLISYACVCWLMSLFVLTDITWMSLLTDMRMPLLTDMWMFVCVVQEVISEDMRATLNAFLYRTGEQSQKWDMSSSWHQKLWAVPCIRSLSSSQR